MVVCVQIVLVCLLLQLFWMDQKHEDSPEHKSARMTLDPSSVMRERQSNEGLTLSASSFSVEKSCLSKYQRDDYSLTNKDQVDKESGRYGSATELRGSEFCSSTPEPISPLLLLPIHTLHWQSSKNAYYCHDTFKNEHSSKCEQCKDFMSLSSNNILWSERDKRHASISQLQGHCHKKINYSSRQTHTNVEVHGNSKFLNISHNKKPPVFTRFHRNRTFFNSFTNFLFTIFLLASLFSPSSTSPSSSSTKETLSSPNLMSWNLAALKTVDIETESRMSNHRTPIPDATTIVGRLFQFQVPDSAFSGEVSTYKVYSKK